MSEASTAPAAAPAAPSTTSAPAAPAAPSQPAANDAKPASSDSPAKPEESKGIPESRAKPQAEREPPKSKQEVKKDAAKELRERLEAKRQRELEEDQGEPTQPNRPSAKDADKAAQRAPDGKFAPKDAQAKPDAQTPPAVPDQPPKRDVGETEARLSRAVRELTNKTTEVEQIKRQHTEVTGKLSQYEERDKREKANPLEALHRLGYTLDSVVDGVVGKKFDAPWQRAQMDPQMRAEFDRLKSFADRFEQQEQERQQAQQREQERVARERDTGKVKQYIEGNATKYPFAASLPWAANVVLGNTLHSKQTDALPHLVAFEKSMRETVLGLVGNDAVLEALLESQPALRKKLAAKFGGASQEADPPASDGAGKRAGADGPRSLSSVSGERAPAPKSRAELKREAAAGLKDLVRRRREADDD